MKGTFLSTSAPWVATPFFGNIKGGLKKGFYLPEPLQSFFPMLISHCGTRHVDKYIYFPKSVNKKMRIAKKYLLVSGLGRKKVGLTHVRIAKKIHSSLLGIIEH
jgi:hypothetical protein